MVGNGIIFRIMSAFTAPNENIAIISDPTLYLIQTRSQNYTGKIAFQNDTFMKVELMTERQKVVKILKQNIQKVEIVNH
jgi:hypothetical protein